MSERTVERTGDPDPLREDTEGDGSRYATGAVAVFDRNAGPLVVMAGTALIVGTLLSVFTASVGTPWRYLLGSFPVVIGVLLVATGYRLWTRENAGLDAVFNRWAAAGFLGIMVLTLYFTLAAEFVPPSDEVPRQFALLVTLGSGVLYGTLLGTYIRQTYRQREALRERKAELAAQVERLDNFASVVSHDLRNPLNVASGRLELARKERDSEHFDAIEGAHDRMEDLIEDLLMLARQGDAVADVEPVRLDDLARQCWRNVETAAADLVVDADATARADATRLGQLVENLVRNAVEHGGEDVTITVGTFEDGFYVEDDGPGIPEERRDTVFEFGVSTTTGGTGLGLAIVGVIAEAHGWEVSVVEGTAGGARFEFTGVEFVA